MRCLKKNKQNLYYALLIGETPEYELDEYGNKKIAYVEDGVTYYVETGTKLLLYSAPVAFEGNIALSGSDVIRQEFGVSDERGRVGAEQG